VSVDGPEAGAGDPTGARTAEGRPERTDDTSVDGPEAGARTAEGRPERTDSTSEVDGGRRVQVPPACDLTLGMVCTDKSTPGRTTWVMGADERFANPVGIVQGGFLAALCDSAMGASAITWARERGLRVVVANVELKCSFVRPAAIGTTLTCTAFVLEGGRRTCFAEADVHDDEQRLVAKSSSTYVLTERG
jgi:uncharacterized protein (TIGR00369 family)